MHYFTRSIQCHVYYLFMQHYCTCMVYMYMYVRLLLCAHYSVPRTIILNDIVVMSVMLIVCAYSRISNKILHRGHCMLDLSTRDTAQSPNTTLA